MAQLSSSQIPSASAPKKEFLHKRDSARTMSIFPPAEEAEEAEGSDMGGHQRPAHHS